jgi:hypothetical protein
MVTRNINSQEEGLQYMAGNSNRESIWKIISIAGFGSVFQYMPPKMQLIVIFALFIALIRDFIKDRERGYSDAPLYIYVCSILIGFLGLSYIIGRDYLNWNTDIQGKVLLIAAILFICLCVSSTVKELKSGDIEQIRRAKLGIIFACIALIIILYLIIDGVQKGIFTF